MNKLKTFTASTARPLPVIVLADTSGSMSVDGKIRALDTALRDMVATFARTDDGRAEIHVAIVTFGGSAEVGLPLAPAVNAELPALQAAGNTPLGAALDLARDMLEDHNQVPSRAYCPALVLVSDGQPNDAWEAGLERLNASERARKAQRFALGIGEDANPEVLREFLGDPEARVYGAAEATQIQSFFSWVTMSVTTRSRSGNPNDPAAIEIAPSDLDELL